MTSIQLVKGMIKLFCQNNIKDKKDTLGYAMYELGCRKLGQLEIDMLIDTTQGLSLLGKILVS